MPLFSFFNNILIFKVSDGLFSTLCNINITIRDVNNHAPMFGRDHFMTSIEENLPIGKCGIYIKWKFSPWDVNRITYLNISLCRNSCGRIECYWFGYRSECRDPLSNTAGKLRWLSDWFEIRHCHYFEKAWFWQSKSVSDENCSVLSPSLSDKATLTVNILDSNDKAPSLKPQTQRNKISGKAEVGVHS